MFGDEAASARNGTTNNATAIIPMQPAAGPQRSAPIIDFPDDVLRGFLPPESFVPSLFRGWFGTIQVRQDISPFVLPHRKNTTLF